MVSTMSHRKTASVLRNDSKYKKKTEQIDKIV